MRQMCCNLISAGDRLMNAQAAVKKEMGMELSKAEKLINKGSEKMNEKIIKKAKMNVPTAGPKGISLFVYFSLRLF